MFTFVFVCPCELLGGGAGEYTALVFHQLVNDSKFDVADVVGCDACRVTLPVRISDTSILGTDRFFVCNNVLMLLSALPSALTLWNEVWESVVTSDFLLLQN